MKPLVETRTPSSLEFAEGARQCRYRLAVHRRDIELFERLFSNWTRGRQRQMSVAHESLDAIEAQLARLEQAVRMTAAA